MILKCNDCKKEIETKEGVFLYGVFYCKDCYREYNSGILGNYPIPVSGQYSAEELQFMVKNGSFVTVELEDCSCVILRSIQSDDDIELYYRINSDRGKLTLKEKEMINKGKIVWIKKEEK
jgi:hypothetical protein